MGFSQTSVDGSALSAEAAGASARSGWLAPLVWLVFALCLVSFGLILPLAATAPKGAYLFFRHSALESPAWTAPQAKVANRSPRPRVLVQKLEAPAVLAPTGTARLDAVSGSFHPFAVKVAVSVGLPGLSARAPPVNGIL